MTVLLRRLLLPVEAATLFLGVAGLVGWGAYLLWAPAMARRDVARFETHRDLAARTATPDQSLWSEKRIVAWRRAVEESAATPLAVLRIPRLRIEVPVLPGTDGAVDRGIEGHSRKPLSRHADYPQSLLAPMVRQRVASRCREQTRPPPPLWST